jgi:phytoene dehydrogenase-like protein
VAEVVVRNGRACGVRLEGGELIESRFGVVAACDPRVTFEHLLPEGAVPESIARRVARIPANADGRGDLKVDLALGSRVHLPRHQAWRSDDLDLRLPTALIGSVADVNRSNAFANAGLLAEPVRCLVASPTFPDPTMAPPGQDTVVIWSGAVPAAPEEAEDSYRKRAESVLLDTAGLYYEGLDSAIASMVHTSADIARRYTVTNGSVYHVDWTPSRLGPLRPAWGLGGYRTPLEGLYLSGAGTHPGGGVGGYPGRNAAREVLRDVKRSDIDSEG